MIDQSTLSKIKDLNAQEKARIASQLKRQLAEKKLIKRSNEQYDVVILGGGFAGATLALQIKQARPESKILIVEKKSFPHNEAAHKVGESLVEISSHYLRDIIGLKDHLQNEQIKKAGLRYFMPSGDNSDITERLELGAITFPKLNTYQIDRGRFENMLFKRNIEQGNQFWPSTRVENLELADKPVDGYAHLISVERNHEKINIAAKWVVDTSGRAGLIKRNQNLQEVSEHNTNAVWFRLTKAVDVSDWHGGDETWRARTEPGIRRAGTVHLMGRGYWVWLIPMSSGGTSIGIVTDPRYYKPSEMNKFDRAIAWLKVHEPQCAKVIEAEKDGLQDFKALRHYSHSCKQVYSENHWCLSGDAGVFADPFYSPGNDFISISNTLVTDLVTRQLDGEDVSARANQYNRDFLIFFQSFMTIFTGRYPIMGNPRIAGAKVVWDWMVYWGFTAFLFFRGNKMFDPELSHDLNQSMQAINDINVDIVTLLSLWDKVEKTEWNNQFVGIFQFNMLVEFYDELQMQVPDSGLAAHMERNVKRFSGVAKLYAKYIKESLEGDYIPQNDSRLGGTHEENLSELRAHLTRMLSKLEMTETELQIEKDLGLIWNKTAKSAEIMTMQFSQEDSFPQREVAL